MSTSPPLEADYYLTYFRQMISIVKARYHDILTKQDHDFIDKVLSADQAACRLLVRLYLRKGPNFLVHKLAYAEVPSIPDAIDILSQLDLIESNPWVYCYELIELLPIAQSRKLFSHDLRCKKADLLDAWLDDETLLTCKQWGVDEAIVSPAHYENLRRIQLLYFGNERQTLTEFILQDLDLFSYENYPLDKDNRLFSSLEDVNTLTALNDLSSEFFLMNEAKDWQRLVELSERVMQLEPSSQFQRKFFKLINKIAYRLEQLGELELALTMFSSNEHPPSKERRCRILFKQANFQTCYDLLSEINTEPQCAAEREFYNRFINKVNKQLGKPKHPATKDDISTIHHQWQPDTSSVEEQAVKFFGDAVWLENKLPIGIFGLVYWPAVFANVAGVWHHPFQVGPTDLTDPSFSGTRKMVIADIKHQTKADWRNAIISRWQSKQGIRNPFVQWKYLTLDWLLRCFDALTQAQWQGVFDHILADIRQHRSGLPDLFQLTEQSYRFIEIKGPGDKLQDNQRQWLRVFKQYQINVDVCYVEFSKD